MAKCQKEYREAHKEYVAYKKKQWREENREHIKEVSDRWYGKNKKYVIERNKAYRTQHRSKNRKEKKEQTPEERLEKRRIIDQRREARKKLLPATLTEEQWEIIKQYFNNRCAYCGKKLPLQQEHFIPLSKGGAYTHNNIIPACGQCNSHKHSKDFFEWYPGYRYYSKKREASILKFLGYAEQGTQQPALMI